MRYKMKLVKMLVNENGCDQAKNGSTLPVKSYVKGQEYDIGDSLAKAFLNMKVCEVIKKRSEPKKNTDSNEKQSDKVPENKMNTDESDNK